MGYESNPFYGQQQYLANQQLANSVGWLLSGFVEPNSFLEALFGGSGNGNLGASASYGPDSDGWYNYADNPPNEKALCQFKQHKDGVPWVGHPSDFSPYFNVAYLKWRLTGIAKEAGFNEWSLG